MSDLTPEWHASKLVVMATLAAGPDAGAMIGSLSPRSEFRKLLSLTPSKLRTPAWLESVRRTTREQVLKGVRNLNPSNDNDFMANLLLLMCAKLAVGEQALEKSGIFSLMLAVNPDTTQPWTKRGFISRDHQNHPEMFAELV